MTRISLSCVARFGNPPVGIGREHTRCSADTEYGNRNAIPEAISINREAPVHSAGVKEGVVRVECPQISAAFPYGFPRGAKPRWGRGGFLPHPVPKNPLRG